MATDLNLHRKTATMSPETEEGKARDREVHNRERTWLLCFSLDRSVGAQMGKPFSIKEEWVLFCSCCCCARASRLSDATRRSSIIRNALQWLQTPLASRHDFALAAYVVGHLVVGYARGRLG